MERGLKVQVNKRLKGVQWSGKCKKWRISRKSRVISEQTEIKDSLNISDSWIITKREEKKVGTFEIWVQRPILRVPWIDRRSNRWVLEK